MKVTQDHINKLTGLRRELHQYPEVSGEERTTAQRIKSFILEYCNPTEIIENLGGHGIAVIFDYDEEGPTVLMRCELDALPIQEDNDLSYKSSIVGVSHKCGHDGHMSMVAGLVFTLSEMKLKKGRVVLLFQPAEETGKGARAVLEDPRFESIIPDYAFALHNIPGAEVHDIILLDNGFSATVQSFSVKLKGKKSHAAEPSYGINPAIAVSKMIAMFDGLNNDNPYEDDFRVITPIHVDLGEKAYGVSPSDAELHYTIRTWSEDEMRKLEDSLKVIILEVSQEQQLEVEIQWFEYFPGAAVDSSCNTIIGNVAQANGFKMVEQAHPFRFGEDFGWIARKYKSAMFGLGAGVETPALHNAQYDFPDELIPTGTLMFVGIIQEILG